MKTSIVYATIKCVVKHADDQDPEDVVCEANYAVAIDPDPEGTPIILSTEMVETENKGECDPKTHALLPEILMVDMQPGFVKPDENHPRWPQHAIQGTSEEELEQLRRDEKNGLYPQHEDHAN